MGVCGVLLVCFQRHPRLQQDRWSARQREQATASCDLLFDLRLSSAILLCSFLFPCTCSSLSPSAGQLSLNFSSCNVADVAEAAVMMCYEMAMSKGLSLTWSIEPSLPPMLFLDSTRLQQILLNLTSNVREACISAPPSAWNLRPRSMSCPLMFLPSCCYSYLCSGHQIHKVWRFCRAVRQRSPVVQCAGLLCVLVFVFLLRGVQV